MNYMSARLSQVMMPDVGWIGFAMDSCYIRGSWCSPLTNETPDHPRVPLLLAHSDQGETNGELEEKKTSNRGYQGLDECHLQVRSIVLWVDKLTMSSKTILRSYYVRDHAASKSAGLVRRGDEESEVVWITAR